MAQKIARRPNFGVTVAQIRLSSEGPVTCDELTVEILQYYITYRGGKQDRALLAGNNHYSSLENGTGVITVFV